MTHPEPAHAGRILTPWFDRAGGLSHPQSDPEVCAPFIAMEGDTLPFLLREIRRDSAALHQPGQIALAFRTLLRPFGMQRQATASLPGERARTTLILAGVVAKA